MVMIKNIENGIKIRISQLPNGVYEFHFITEPSEIKLEDNFKRKVDVCASLDKTSRQIFLKAVIKSSGFFECDRCLEIYEQTIENQFTKFFVYDKIDEEKYPEEEVQVISLDTAFLDISEDVRQTVLLGVPLKLLCDEECKGLCPQCGANLNKQVCNCTNESLDPRWEILKDLIKE